MASSGNEQQLRFRWNDHMQHLSKVLTLQRFEEQFCDVTLVSDDGFVMKAHQAILASTSAYFQRVFSDITPDQHPMVVLRGANFREMTCLLDYMYQGSTQVHQSLMEAVLEVADMLEVKGLSQIRSNNSIKKFMAPPSSNSASNSTNTSTHVHPGDNNVGHSRSSDEQSGPHSSEEQGFRDSQSRSSELENTWIRFTGNNTLETHSKESTLTHSEVVATSSEEPPPSSHVRLLPCQEMSTQETQEEPQVSGMDLSMAKNEPWSPRVSSPNGNKNSPSRKRRKLLEGICTEETLESVSDPEWGRSGSKVDERTVSQPRTISFTSITSEPGSSTDLCSDTEASIRYSANAYCQPDTAAPEVSSHHNTSLIAMQHFSRPSSSKHKESRLSNIHRIHSRPYVTCRKGPCKTEVVKYQTPIGTDSNVYQIERNVCKEALKLELPQTGSQAIESDSHCSKSITRSCYTKVGTSLHVQKSFGIESLDDQVVTGPQPISESDHNAPLLPQRFSNDRPCSENIQETELNQRNFESCNLLVETKRCQSKEIESESLSDPQSFSHSELSEVQVIEPCDDTNISGDGSLIYVTEQQQCPLEDSGSGVAILTGEYGLSNTKDATSLASENLDRDPLEIPAPYGESSTREDTIGVTSFVSVMHKERVMVKYNVPEKKPLCPLEEKLVKPKSHVKRPLNPYILFQSEMKKKVMEEYPGEHYQSTLRRLGFMWKNLSIPERQIWQRKAENLKREHKNQNPDYYYNPYEACKKRQQYLKARTERSQLYRVASPNACEDNSAVIVSPSLYKVLKREDI